VQHQGVAKNPTRDAPLGFWLLFWVRPSRRCHHQLTPYGHVGGEVAKAVLFAPALRYRSRRVAGRGPHELPRSGKPSWCCSPLRDPRPHAPHARAGTRIVVAFSASPSAAYSASSGLQRRGIFATAIASVNDSHHERNVSAHPTGGARPLDGHLVDFYRDRPAPSRPLYSATLADRSCLLSSLSSSAALGSDLDRDVPPIEAFALVLDSAAFLSGPDRRAGGRRVLVFTTFGLGAATGLAVAVIVRLNQLAVAALGLAAFAKLSVTPLPPWIAETQLRPESRRKNPAPRDAGHGRQHPHHPEPVDRDRDSGPHDGAHERLVCPTRKEADHEDHDVDVATTRDRSEATVEGGQLVEHSPV